MIPHSAKLTITPEILALVAELDEFKGSWRASGGVGPERLSALRRRAAVENIGASTRIDGGKLSDAEVGRVLSRIEHGRFAARDEQEVAGYAEVMTKILNHPAALEPSEEVIRQLHRDLLRYSTRDRHHRGEYKSTINHISAFDADGKEIIEPIETATPAATPRRMGELVGWLRTTLERQRLHPLLAIPLFTRELLAIHPFQEGNGRLSRLLSTLLLLRAGYTHLPFSALERATEQRGEAYYTALRASQRPLPDDTPLWHPWTIEFLRCLQEQKRCLESEIEQGRIAAESLPELSLLIMELAREHGQVTTGRIVKLLGANRNTVKKHLQSLVRSDHLSQHGHGKGTWYERR